VICRLRGRGRVLLPSCTPGSHAPGTWSAALSTEDPAYTDAPLPIVVTNAPAGIDVRFARPGAVVLTAGLRQTDGTAPGQQAFPAGSM
jgi:hypothetical protein